MLMGPEIPKQNSMLKNINTNNNQLFRLVRMVDISISFTKITQYQNAF